MTFACEALFSVHLVTASLAFVKLLVLPVDFASLFKVCLPRWSIGVRKGYLSWA